MNSGRLLERITRCGHEKPPEGGSAADPLRSVLVHLRRLLNTRQGNVPIAAEFGVPDFLAMLQSFPESVTRMEEAIRSAIERYEPRLAEVAVQFRPEEQETLTLRFSISGTLADPTQHRISFESSIDMHGKVRIGKGREEASGLGVQPAPSGRRSGHE